MGRASSVAGWQRVNIRGADKLQTRPAIADDGTIIEAVVLLQFARSGRIIRFVVSGDELATIDPSGLIVMVPAHG